MFVDESPPTTAADPVAPAEQAAGGPGAARGGESDDLSAVRTLILEAHPDVVPDLVTGATVAELLASVEGARAAYAAVAGRLAAMTPDDGLDGMESAPVAASSPPRRSTTAAGTPSVVLAAEGMSSSDAPAAIKLESSRLRSVPAR